MKYTLIILGCFFYGNLFAQTLKQVGTQEGLPVYKVEKDLLKDSKLIGFKVIGDNGVTTRLYSKTSKAGKTTCFFLAFREKATKTEPVGTLYRKTCNCPF